MMGALGVQISVKISEGLVLSPVDLAASYVMVQL